MKSLPSWPPSLTNAQEASLVHLARDWALSHSLIYRPPLSSSSSSSAPPTEFSTSVIHAPFALFPTPFPRELFRLAESIQKSYNALYAAIASDWSFLEKVIGGNVVKVDEFQEGLWKIAKAVREEGQSQPLQLGLFRSDYLLHQLSPSDDLSLKQVEFNTISSSFGALSTKVSELHRHLAASTEEFAGVAGIARADLPENGALKGLAMGLASAHEAYGVQSAQVVFVVQDPERNAFDQRALEWELFEAHGIRSIRLSLAQLKELAHLGSDPERRLFVNSPTASSASRSSAPAIEISTVYFRAGYTPDDYVSPADWETRLLLERSHAIKCPSINLQLAGAKKIQQVLSEPGVLEAFVSDLPGLSEPDLRGLQVTFTSLYPLDESPLGKEAQRLAYSEPERFVLKPQREGGGNNVYRADIPSFLDSLAAKDSARGLKPGEASSKEGYILMDMILPPSGLQNSMVRAAEERPRIGEVVSELGIYGVALYDSTKKGEMTVNGNAGHLLRTKGRESDEGGVAVGFSVIDSPWLVD